MYSTLFSCTKLVATNYIMDRLFFQEKNVFVLFCFVPFFPPFHTSTDCGKIIYVVIQDVIHDVRLGLSKMVLVDNRLQKSFKIKPDSLLRCRIWQIQEFFNPIWIHNQQKRWIALLKWLLKGNALSTGSLRKIMEISPENLNGYWDFKGTI